MICVCFPSHPSLSIQQDYVENPGLSMQFLAFFIAGSTYCAQTGQVSPSWLQRTFLVSLFQLWDFHVIVSAQLCIIRNAPICVSSSDRREQSRLLTHGVFGLCLPVVLQQPHTVVLCTFLEFEQLRPETRVASRRCSGFPLCLCFLVLLFILPFAVLPQGSGCLFLYHGLWVANIFTLGCVLKLCL